jgi:pimeloyl-ACP methyl ester carboxylesterase
MNLRKVTLAVTVAAAASRWTACPSMADAEPSRADGGGPPSAEVLWVATPQRLKVEAFRSPAAGARPTLIVILHGDAPFTNPTYQYRFAQQVAANTDNVIAAAILRPGYSDGSDRSEGKRGWTTGDNYAPDAIDAIDATIDDLKARYRPGRVILVGHSGGAAIAADLLGRHPSAADGAVLVSCPCDVPEWRKYMRGRQGFWSSLVWYFPVRSLSPLDEVGAVSTEAKVWMVVGANDQVAPPTFTQRYADALRARGIQVSVTIAPGLPHNILLEPVVMTVVTEALAEH